MSRYIKQLTVDIENKIFQNLVIEPEEDKYGNAMPTIEAFQQTDKSYYVPFAYDRKIKRPSRDSFTQINPIFNGELRPEQKKVRKEAILSLNKYGSVIIAAHTGFGKSITALNIASKIQLKTLILIHRIVLMNQWKKDIKHIFPKSSVQILKPETKMKDCDFYIMNPTNIHKNSREMYKDIGLVIVDEAHLILAEKLSKSLLYLSPRYLLGLSATPYREDHLNILFDLYFGKKKIERKLWRKHTAYMVRTTFEPEIELMKNGRLNWSVVLDSICSNEKRNELIIDILKLFSERVFLVLCKRIFQAKYIVKRLKEEGEDVTSLIEKQQTFDHTSRILVGTTGKCSTGFDHKKLNALLLASDMKQYYIQALGRVFRTPEVEPIVIDIVDNNHVLKKHAKTRQNVYIEHGGTVKDFHKEFPKIKL